MDNAKQGAIQAIQDEIAILEQEISALKRVSIRLQGGQNTNQSYLPTVPTVAGNTTTALPESSGQPPHNGKKVNGKKVKDFLYTPDQSIVNILKEQLDRAARLSEIQDSYESLTGKNRNLRGDIIKLRKKGVVTSIKFNNNWNLQYTGLAEWVEQTPQGPRFVEEHFILDVERFPYGIEKSEIIGDYPKNEQQKGHTEGVA